MITWFHGDLELFASSDRIDISITTEEIGMGSLLVHSQLHINDTRLSDAGEYSCVAGNSEGNVSVQIQLIVRGEL